MKATSMKNNMNSSSSNKKPNVIQYYTSSVIAGKKHHYVVTYDKALGVMTKPQDFIFNKNDLKKWI